MELFAHEIMSEVKTNPTFQGFSKEDKERLFFKWAHTSAALELIIYLNEHSNATDRNWTFKAYALGHLGYYQNAIKLVLENSKEPEIPNLSSLDLKSESEIERYFKLHDKDIVAGSFLLKKQVTNNEFSKALVTLKILQQAEKVPLYVSYWEGMLYYKQNNYSKSWPAFERYLTSMSQNTQKS